MRSSGPAPASSATVPCARRTPSGSPAAWSTPTSSRSAGSSPRAAAKSCSRAASQTIVLAPESSRMPNASRSVRSGLTGLKTAPSQRIAHHTSRYSGPLRSTTPTTSPRCTPAARRPAAISVTPVVELGVGPGHPVVADEARVAELGRARAQQLGEGLGLRVQHAGHGASVARGRGVAEAAGAPALCGFQRRRAGRRQRPLRIIRETSGRRPGARRALSASPTRAPDTWRRPASPRSCQAISHTWAMPDAPIASPWESRAAARVDRQHAAQRGERALHQLGSLPLRRELQRLVRGHLAGRGAVVDLGEIHLLGAQARALVGEQRRPRDRVAGVAVAEQHRRPHPRRVAAEPPPHGTRREHHRGGAVGVRGDHQAPQRPLEQLAAHHVAGVRPATPAARGGCRRRACGSSRRRARGAPPSRRSRPCSAAPPRPARAAACRWTRARPRGSRSPRTARRRTRRRPRPATPSASRATPTPSVARPGRFARCPGRDPATRCAAPRPLRRPATIAATSPAARPASASAAATASRPSSSSVRPDRPNPVAPTPTRKTSRTNTSSSGTALTSARMMDRARRRGGPASGACAKPQPTRRNRARLVGLPQTLHPRCGAHLEHDVTGRPATAPRRAPPRATSAAPCRRPPGSARQPALQQQDEQREPRPQLGVGIVHHRQPGQLLDPREPIADRVLVDVERRGRAADRAHVVEERAERRQQVGLRVFADQLADRLLGEGRRSPRCRSWTAAGCRRRGRRR